jgi:hypothetical protein
LIQSASPLIAGSAREATLEIALDEDNGAQMKAVDVTF